MSRPILALSRLALVTSLMSSSWLAHADDLLQIYQMAQTKDPVVLAAKAERDRAYEAINEARAANLPQIGLGFDTFYVKTNKDDRGTNFNYGGSLNLSQSLYNSTNWANLTIVEKSATAQEAIYNIEEQRLILRTATAYFNVLRAIDGLDTVKANKVAVSRQLEQTRQRYEVGLTAITNVHEAKAEYDRTVAEEINAQNNVSNSYEALRELTGVEHRNLSVLNLERFSPELPTGGSQLWLATANDNNLALNLQRINKDVAQSAIDLAETGNDPRLDLVAGLGTRSTHYKDDYVDAAQGGNLTNGSIGLQFNWPFYQGGAVGSRVQQAQFAYVKASEEMEQTYRSVQSQVTNSYNNVNASLSAIRAYEQAVISANSALSATEAGYEVGTRTIVDVLDATRKLYSDRNQLNNARYDYLINTLNLRYAAGTLAEADVEAINASLKPAVN